MYGRERRQQADKTSQAALRQGLTREQCATLDTMHQFGWELEFVRRPLFQPPVPVAVDRIGKRHAVIEADGSITESSEFRIRG